MSKMIDYQVRLARVEDAEKISLLYYRVYEGKYPDPLMRDRSLMEAFLHSPDDLWVVVEKTGEIVCSVLYEVDPANRLAKTFGGVVLPEHRGAGLLEKALEFGFKTLTENQVDGVEVVYATTRTATKAAQVVTAKMGYRRLGIFPNVHRTSTYETHCLVALFNKDALSKRRTDFLLHPDLNELFQIVKHECDLPAMQVASLEQAQALFSHETGSFKDYPLELIDAPKYVIHRFRELVKSGQIHFHFYPFHEPNLILTSPCEQVQVFFHLAPLDQYCTIVAVRKPANLSTKILVDIASDMLRDRGVRYIETIVRADRLGIINDVMEAGYIPCAYFPAFQVQNNQRHDYVVLSRTFEMLDFRNIELEGANRDYLLHYFSQWKKKILDKTLLESSLESEAKNTAHGVVARDIKTAFNSQS